MLFSKFENVEIPQMGLGTFDLKEKEILAGIETGYRLLDTAWQYGNEVDVGRAIKKSSVKREAIVVTTKLWTEDIRKKQVRRALEDSLRNLQTDYVDLYLIHWPAVGYLQAWEVMLKLKEEGKVKEIGVSNFQKHHIETLKEISDIMPTLNQIECHPYFQNKEIISYCEAQGILTQAWCPLGGSYSKFIEHDIFIKLAEKYRKTPAQIILRWHIQKNMYVIPRTSSVQRLKQNLEVFDFVIDEGDMKLIDGLDTGRRIGADPDNFNF